VTVYVDDMRAKYGRMVMCHMIADTDAELHAMVDKIGVQRKWFQTKRPGHQHYDIALSKRALAVKHGAREITHKQCGLMCANRAALGALGDPETAEQVFKARLAAWRS
jgi:hypothetical protein